MREFPLAKNPSRNGLLKTLILQASDARRSPGHKLQFLAIAAVGVFPCFVAIDAEADRLVGKLLAEAGFTASGPFVGTHMSQMKTARFMAEDTASPQAPRRSLLVAIHCRRAPLLELEAAVQIDVLPGLFRSRHASGPSVTSGAAISRRRSDAPPKTLTRTRCDQGRGTGF